MKVLHVIPSLGPLRGGPSFVLPRMAASLAAAGVEVHVVATDDNGPGRLRVPLQTPIRQDGVTTWYFPRQSRFYTFSWPLTRWLLQHTRDYDLVHIHALFSYASGAAAYCARRARIPYIIRPLGTLNRWGMENRRPRLKEASFRFVEHPILKQAAAVHYTSIQEQDDAYSLGVTTRAALIPLGVDIPAPDSVPSPAEFLTRYPQLAERPIVLFLSRLDPKKGLDLLLPAFAEVHRSYPETALVIAGEGQANFVATLQALAETLEITADIFWTGFLKGSVKDSALAAATVFVLPSYSENFGIAAVEALTAGVPVVLSDQVGLASDVVATEAGLVVPCAVPALAAAITQLLADPAFRHTLASNGQKVARARFSLEAMAQNLVTLYKSIVESAGVNA